MERNIYFKCSCGKVLAVNESGVGKTVKCPACGHVSSNPIGYSTAKSKG